jgi:hypothetical protein
MSRRLKQAALVLVVLFAVAQLIRPERANPRIDPTHTIQAHASTSALAPILNRSCGDCHSYATEWRWYSQVAPLSWLMAYAVKQGRQTVNFSEWTAYSAEQQRSLLAASCYDAQSGKMPGIYTAFRSETHLSAQDIEAICAASRQTEAAGPTGTDSQLRR